MKLLKRIFDRLTAPSVLYDIRYVVPAGAWRRVPSVEGNLRYTANHGHYTYEVINWDIDDEPWATAFRYKKGTPDSSHFQESYLHV